ncbi:MAG: type II toxin-antitoxin system RelE/ParE family toxin [Aquabacterium sp.]
MKAITFLGNSLACLRDFPEDARQDAGYVLHAFQKKTQATSKQDIEIARSRYTELMRGR